MFLRCSARKKDGKEHRYWSLVENRRVAGDRVVQRHALGDRAAALPLFEKALTLKPDWPKARLFRDRAQAPLP